MPKRLVSLDLKLPLMMCAIVLVSGAIIGVLAYRQFHEALYESAGGRLRSSALLIASSLAEGAPGARALVDSLARVESVRAHLERGGDSATGRATLLAALPQNLDSSYLRVRAIGRDGSDRAEVRLREAALAPSWAARRAPAGGLTADGAQVSPLLGGDSIAQYEVIAPVRSAVGGRIVGHVVATRATRARGVDAVRRLSGEAVMLIGTPGDGVWSDLERVAPPPPEIAIADSVIRFDASAYGAGVGIAEPIAGTPWVLWMHYSRAQVLAPMRALLIQLTALVLVGVALATLAAWAASRRITGRITKLTRTVDRQALPDAAPVRALPALTDGKDELDRLELAFTQMTLRVEQQQRIEAQLSQAQKLEAIGRLAGGIAHDFNNVLTVVTNFGEIVRSDLDPGSEAARDMDEIIRAAERASRLTRQLLAFSRRQVLQPVQLDLNDVVSAATKMLRRVIPTDVELETELHPALAPVHADPGQIEQVLLNLTLNAADAMPCGGRLTFRTAMVEVEDLPGPDGALAGASGRHVCLVVRDTGVGMDAETAQRAFEPFFTTKPAGKGTGLGLASVHGIITQLGGRIWLGSRPGAGTTVRIFLPESEGAAESAAHTLDTQVPAAGSGTVLLVEDDLATREVTRRLLVAHGFDVVVADHGAQALDRLESEAGRIRLVLSDVMMPVMNGIELGRRIAAQYPAIPVVLMSGYSDASIHERDPDGVRWPIVEKPFTGERLLRAVSAALREP